MEKVDYKGYIIEIEQDENPESPREWDNLTTMICFHKKYNLGDKHDIKHQDYSSWNEMEQALIKKYKGMLGFAPNLKIEDLNGVNADLENMKYVKGKLDQADIEVMQDQLTATGFLQFLKCEYWDIDIVIKICLSHQYLFPELYLKYPKSIFLKSTVIKSSRLVFMIPVAKQRRTFAMSTKSGFDTNRKISLLKIKCCNVNRLLQQLVI